ncbi:hypothetical protein [Tunicatimonas pelagia]|uniref:hypothetical protein n=1 Tax=Tunicatimonas pelagia TaxID=931531 RepID=UPI0026664F86|nr:hypothetical protein [Tunicatimonas pelagia]WKN43817.1 hypothetical protein P0M28_02380 [Tunicatimonas pelagia]
MDTLHQDWLTRDLVDFEYKKYVLLAYMQKVKSRFIDRELYPFMSDLVFHYNNLLSLQKNKQLIYENFPKEVSKADFEQLKIHYREIVQDSELMSTLEEIVNFSLPHFKERVEEGAEIYETIAKSISIESVGIMPLYKNEGYLLLSTHTQGAVYVYHYKIMVSYQAEETYRTIRTQQLDEVSWSLSNSFEQIKRKLISSNQELPNPATYLAISPKVYPLKPTLLPIAKRLLVQHIGKAA